MVLLDLSSRPKASMEFDCEISPIDKIQEVRVIKNGYQPLICTQTIRQCARIINENDSEMVLSENTRLKLKFLYRPEYIEQDTKLMIRDTFVTALGKITKVYYIDENQ